jgi:hypothetical protein
MNKQEKDKELIPKRFYVDPKLVGRFYYLEKIEGELAYWIIIESFHRGNLIQVKFTQSIHAQQYIEVTNKDDIKRLQGRLKKFRMVEKETEFNKMMESIDEGFKQRGLQPFQRPIHAFSEVCKLKKITLKIIPDGPAIPGVYEGDSLSSHIHEWYKKRYGDALKFDPSPGCAVVLIKGNPYKIKYPLLHGQAKFEFGPDLDKYKELPKIPVNQPLIVNPLNTIEKLTHEVAKQLSRAEMLDVAKFYMVGFEVAKSLMELKEKPYIAAAKADLEIAVNNIVQTNPHYGQSRWASLQFTEKYLKCFLKLKTVAFKKDHKLQKTADLAIKNGAPNIPAKAIQDIQCSAATRYGEEKVTLQEAIKAHHASIEVCSRLIPAIRAIK